MTISDKVWTRYLTALRRMSDEAAAAMTAWMGSHDFSTYEGKQALIRYAYALATKYGEGAGALACQMYDALADLSGVILPRPYRLRLRQCRRQPGPSWGL